MKKFIVNSSLLIVHCLILLSISNYLLPIVYAVESSPSAEIKAKVQQFIKDSASKAAQLKKELIKNLQNRAYVGSIKTKSLTAITIASKNGPRIVNITQDTQFQSQIKGKKYSLKLISEEDYVAALGDVDENQVLTAKSLILLPQPKADQPSVGKTYLWGQIVSLSSKLVTLKDKNLKTVSISLPKLIAVKQSNFVIITGNLNEQNIFQADFVYIIPQGGFIKTKKIATPSAQIATKSATPKPTSR